MSDLARILGDLQALLRREVRARNELAAVAVSLRALALQARRISYSGNRLGGDLPQALGEAAASCNKAVGKLQSAESAITAYLKETETSAGFGAVPSYPAPDPAVETHEAFEQANVVNPDDVAPRDVINGALIGVYVLLRWARRGRR